MGIALVAATSLLKNRTFTAYLLVFFSGLLLAMGFAPFHLPGLSIIALALFYTFLEKTPQSAFLYGLYLGLGFFGLGTSWVYISIHEYGHLSWVISAFLTFLFLLYLSLFPAIAAILYRQFRKNHAPMANTFLFAALWTLSEYTRASLFTGFPWLLVGFGQFDSPLKYLLPIVGVLGVSFITALIAGFLSLSFQHTLKRYSYLFLFIFATMSPNLLQGLQWAKEEEKPIKVGVVQANISMRDKWDEQLFWHILRTYQEAIDALLGNALIVLPESAIPLPRAYTGEVLDTIQQNAEKAHSSVLLGIVEALSFKKNMYANTVLGLGSTKHSYQKQHLVPFGEYIPKPFRIFGSFIPNLDAHLQPGKQHQPLIEVNDYPIATLICYELAYQELLRKQLPLAKWIVSINDVGWFGHSLAIYQHQQIAQVLSLLSARYQIMSNNDGLSSIIDPQGKLQASLPAFQSASLEGTIVPLSGTTPWVRFGDNPALFLCMACVIFCILRKKYQKFYCCKEQEALS